MKRTTTLFLPSLLWLIACGDDGTEAPRQDAGNSLAEDAGIDAGSDAGVPDASSERSYVSIAFKAMIGEQEFSCDRTYSGLGTASTEVTPKDLRAFVQDVKLIRKSDGMEVPLELDERPDFQRTDVTLLDFETNSDHCTGAGGTEATNHLVTGWVPKADYQGLVFANGVPAEVNHQNPTKLSAPLTAGPLHWNWTSGFLFFDLQLREASDMGDAGTGDAGLNDAGEDAGADAPGSLVVHIGSSACGAVGCNKSNRNRVRLPEFQPGVHGVILDVAKLVEPVDMREVNTCHVVGVKCHLFLGPFGIDGETGGANDTQALYRLETL